MVRLQQGPNQIYMTLDESNYGSSYSVLRAVDNMSGAESLCILGNDISPNPSRYNQFSLIVASSSVNNTTLVLNNEGQYNYEIWAMIGDAPVGTASILYNGTLLEKGRIILQENVNNTISVYSGVVDFATTPMNSIRYLCDNNFITASYGQNETNLTDLINMFNSVPPVQIQATFLDYGISYDNGDGRVRMEMSISAYNSLSCGGTITLDVIYD